MGWIGNSSQNMRFAKIDRETHHTERIFLVLEKVNYVRDRR